MSDAAGPRVWNKLPVSGIVQDKFANASEVTTAWRYTNSIIIIIICLRDWWLQCLVVFLDPVYYYASGVR